MIRQIHEKQNKQMKKKKTNKHRSLFSAEIKHGSLALDMIVQHIVRGQESVLQECLQLLILLL